MFVCMLIKHLSKYEKRIKSRKSPIRYGKVFTRKSAVSANRNKLSASLILIGARQTYDHTRVAAAVGN